MNIFNSSIVMIIIYCITLAISEFVLFNNYQLPSEKLAAIFIFGISTIFAVHSRQYLICIFLGILITILVRLSYLKLASKEQKEKEFYKAKKRTEIFNGKIIAHGYEQNSYFFDGGEKITVSIDGKTKTLYLTDNCVYNSDKQIIGSNVKFNGLDEILEIY